MDNLALPSLPLLLWDTPPGLEMILVQEGVPFSKIRSPHPLAFGGGRFVLYDGRQLPRARVKSVLSPRHVAIDINLLREGEPEDPFAQLLDTSAAPLSWNIAGFQLKERVGRISRAALRIRLLGRLRALVTRSGGLWARLGVYPFPYRSAFNFRVDLDEPCPDDYARFARMRRPLADCTTHFVNTHAYGRFPEVLADLREYDTQSHAHFHVIYRTIAENRQNLERAQRLLNESGFAVIGFAAPGGRWNPALDRVLEDLGYSYSSEFQVGHDDLPFFPWRGNRFSRVLQVPIHPVCEGLFLEAGLDHPWPIADYLVSVVQSKRLAGEPAFIYGHPERRLARFPEVLSAVASAVASESFLWRVTMTDFARWWRWRSDRRWSVFARGAGLFEVQFEDWDTAYPLCIEVQRGEHVATIPIRSARESVHMAGLAYERRRIRADLPAPTLAPQPWSLKSALRSALDWETVTPIEELHEGTFRGRWKKRLRRWQSGRGRR